MAKVIVRDNTKSKQFAIGHLRKRVKQSPTRPILLGILKKLPKKKKYLEISISRLTSLKIAQYL